MTGPRLDLLVRATGLSAARRLCAGRAPSNSANREVFDGFWQIVIDDFGSITHSMENDTRQTYARTYLTGICREVGVPLSVDLMIELSRARGKLTYDMVWRRFDQVLASREEQPDHPIASAQQIGDAYAGHDDQLEPSEQ